MNRYFQIKRGTGAKNSGLNSKWHKNGTQMGKNSGFPYKELKKLTSKKGHHWLKPADLQRKI